MRATVITDTGTSDVKVSEIEVKEYVATRTYRFYLEGQVSGISHCGDVAELVISDSNSQNVASLDVVYEQKEAITPTFSGIPRTVWQSQNGLSHDNPVQDVVDSVKHEIPRFRYSDYR